MVVVVVAAELVGLLGWLGVCDWELLVLALAVLELEDSAVDWLELELELELKTDEVVVSELMLEVSCEWATELLEWVLEFECFFWLV